MKVNNQATLESLQRGVARSKEWGRQCYSLINSYTREHDKPTLSLEKWKEVYACFRLDTFYSSDIDGILNDFYGKLSEYIPLQEIKKIVLNKLPVIMSAIVVKKSESEDRVSLKYAPIQDAFTISHSHFPNKGVIVNGLATERQDTYTLFEDDPSLGVYSPSDDIACAIIPNTLYYSKYVISQLGDRYIVLSSSKNLPLENIERLEEDIYLYTTEDDVNIHPNPFPYRREYLNFDSMIDNLRKSEERTWSVGKGHYNLGIVVREFDTTYDQADSISDIFSEQVRIMCNERGKLSPYEQWKKLQWKKLSETTREKRELVYSMSRGCNLFNAALAVHCYRRFGGNESRVLDPFAGYGDRALGAYVADCSVYYGFDTNPDLFPCYEEIAKVTDGMEFISVQQPFEKFIVTKGMKGYFDCSLLSPPFFTYEMYRGEKTSTTLYSTLDEWIKHFWDVCIYKTLQMLRVGGYIMFYIPTGKDDISQRMNESVKRICEQQEYVGVLGFTQTRGGAIRSTIVYKKIL